MAEVLRFDLLANDKASAVFSKVGKSAEGTESKFSKAGKGLATFGKIAAVGIAAGATAAVIGGKHFLTLGTSLEQMDMKAKTVFGGQIKTVDKWASKSASAMGLTATQATGLAANFGDLLIPMGFTRKEAAKMSTDTVGLSGALSQWSGGTISAAEASDVLAKAMLGERDGLKALGISISDADVKARLLKNGQDKLTGSALQQATATATQQLIMEKSTDAQAAYAKGGAPLLAMQAEMKALFGELQEVIAKKLIPVFTSIGKVVLGVVKAFDKGGLGGAVDYVQKQIGSALPKIQSKLGEWAVAFGAWVQNAVPPMLTKMEGLVSSLGKWLIGTALPMVEEGVAKWGKAFAEWIGPIIPPMLERLGKLYVRMQAWLWGTAYPALGKALLRLGKAFVEWVAPMIPPMLVALGKLLAKLTQWIVMTGFPAIALGMGKMGKAAVGGLIGGIGGRFGDLTAKMNALKDRILSKFTDAPSMLIMRGRQAIGGLIGGIGEKLGDLGTRISAAKSRIVDKFAGAAAWLAGAGAQTIAGLIGGIGGRLEDLGGKIGAAKDRITNVFSNAGSWLYSAGSTLVQGLIDGIQAKIDALVAKMQALAQKIKDHMPGSPVKTGPLTSWNDGAAGKRLVDLLAGGLEDTRPVDAAMKRLAGHVNLSDIGTGAVTLAGARPGGWSASGPGVGGGGSVVYNFHIHDASDPQRVVAAIRAYVKRNGPLRGVTV